MKPGTYRMHILAAVAVGISLSSFSGSAAAASPEEKRAEIRKMRSETLAKLQTSGSGSNYLPNRTL